MPTTTTGSSNVAVLDSKIIASLCDGKFYIDLTPTTYIGSGSLNVLGAMVRIINPLGVVIKEYATSGYDIEGGSPPMQDVVEVSIPTVAGNFQYGAYVVEVELFEDDVTSWVITKTVTISIPNTKNKTKNYGIVSATIKGLCQEGKATIQVDTPPNYRGNIVESQENDFTLEYPTGSDLDELETEITAFSVPLFEGIYKITGTICATYNAGDNVYYEVNYRLNYEKKVGCILNYECIGIQLESLLSTLQTDCTDEERQSTINRISHINGLVKAIENLADANQDTSDLINNLDELLDCSCTCDDMTGTPIVNNNPAKDFIITGCGVDKTTVGLTDSYEINVYDYQVSITSNDILQVSGIVTDGCTKTILLNFSASNLLATFEEVVQVHTTGSSVTVNNNTDVLLINPASVLGTLEITLAASPNSFRKELKIMAGGTIGAGDTVATILSVVPNAGQTLLETTTPDTLTSGDTLQYKFLVSPQWRRL